MSDGAALAVLGAFGYLMGSIPTAIWVGRVHSGLDVRKFGSGNAGATNVFRVLGPLPALVVFVVDVAKGFFPALLAMSIAGSAGAIIAGGAAVCGHRWPLFARFRGGKCVATAAGMFLSIAPGSVAVGLVGFAVVFSASRIVSLSNLAATATFTGSIVFGPVGGVQHDPVVLVAGLVVLPFIVFTHRDNLQRLLAGRELPIKGARGASGATSD